MSVSTALVRDPHGAPRYYVAQIMDVTDRRMAEEQLRRLAADPQGLSATAIEEMLRFDSPLQLFERTAKEDTEVAGVPLRAGEKIAALLGAANRDPAAFDDADRFVVDRSPNAHIAFGAGIHFCLGAPLARLEMQQSLPMLAERFPGLRPAGDPVPRGTFVLRGWESVPVTAWRFSVMPTPTFSGRGSGVVQIGRAHV